MKTPFQLLIEARTAEVPLLGDGDTADTPIRYRDCTLGPHNFSGKELQEIQQFICFARSEEFKKTLTILRPGALDLGRFEIVKNSGGDDPPDLVLQLSGYQDIGVELTDFSPIASMVAKISGAMKGPARIPGISDAKTYHSIKTFMEQPESLTEPHFTSVPAEEADTVSYLASQIRSKDIESNELVLLTNSFMATYPETDFATLAVRQAQPRFIRSIVLVSGGGCALVYAR